MNPTSPSMPDPSQPGEQLPPSMPEEEFQAENQTSRRVTLKPLAKTPLVTYILLGLTVLMFAAQQLSLQIANVDYPFVLLGKINELILQGQLWRLLTPALLHSNLLHIAFNMYALYVFGTRLEPVYGHARFLMLYLLGAFGGNVLSFVLTPNPSLGSSTAIFALLAAEGMLIWQNRQFFGGRARGMLINLGFVLGVNLMIGMTPGSNIDNFGHLGGIFAGFIFAGMAGPVWKLGRDENEIVVKDDRPTQDKWIGAILVFIGFSLMAAIPFFR